MLESYKNLVELIRVQKELKQVIKNSNGHDVMAVNALSLIKSDINNLKKKLVNYVPHQDEKILDKSLDKASDNLFSNIIKHMGVM